MLKYIFGFVIVGVSAQAETWEAIDAEYNKSYLQVEECFEKDPSGRESCILAGIQECVKSLEVVLESRGFEIPSGAGLSPHEYCNYIGRERADEHLNAVYQRILEQGPHGPLYEEETNDRREYQIEELRDAQRHWLQFANKMCSEDNIVGWHYGGSGWGAITAECYTRLSIQQAGNLERYFIIRDYED